MLIWAGDGSGRHTSTRYLHDRTRVLPGLGFNLRYILASL